MLIEMASAGAAAVMLDLIPPAGAALLLISFLKRRNTLRREESELKEIIQSLSKGESDEKITGQNRDKNE